jgi:catechol 2,3-dioxygenase-like lactoylglutathione lyase family enzyme
MPLNLLAHYAIRTARLEETRDFYVELLGFRDGARPPFDFPGHWLYLGERDIVHLIGVDPKDNRGLTDYLGDKSPESLQGTGAIDHIAFQATDLPGLRQRVARRGIKSFERTVPSVGLHQVFLEDPNGITIELNFPASETAAPAESAASGAP